MAYYHNVRDHEKNIRRQSKIRHRLSEIQWDNDCKKIGDPLQLMRINGQSCQLISRTKNHKKSSNGADLVKWGPAGSLVDKFDCRPLLNFIPRDVNVIDPHYHRHLTANDKEINSLLNYERYRSLVLNILSNESDESLLQKVHSTLAARIVQMNYACADESVSSFDKIASIPSRKTDELAEQYGIKGFKKIEKFNSISENNQKYLETQKNKAKAARDIKFFRIFKNMENMKRFDTDGDKNSSGDRFLEVRSSDSEFFADSDDEVAKSLEKTSRRDIKSDGGSLTDFIDNLSEQSNAEAGREDENKEIIKAPKTATMKRFFPELTPVDSVEEAQSWTNSDFIVKRGLKTKERDNEEEIENSGRQKPTTFGGTKEMKKTEQLTVKKQIEKRKMTPSDRLKERMRNAFKKTISKEAEIAERKKRETEMQRRSEMLSLPKKNYNK